MSETIFRPTAPAQVAEARGEICAFADDDLILDPDWVPALVDGFRSDDRVGCVTGQVLPAELETEAQLVLERYSGYSKGFTSRSWSLVRRVPRGIRQTLHRAGGAAGPRDGSMGRLRRLELLGLLYGPFCYLRSVRLQRQAEIPTRP
ncbi:MULTISPECIES: glycosyltransferase family A protein [unclassified Kitasatospora]|uniref:glycosyltransferase family A protein n=1 Tax=unclassified Kitasatospora TaxID=2633591 RepID=UPI00070E4A88|nr:MULTISPECIES: glycosyltransferase family A protein [unclassified Kitasatospora]KQV12126.1 hypothetical protein ASC99_34730 [Kitasatospora sp. Root107]KRB69287.1 hypothetical protein ASE03_28050 [Kitasatospora sp. Root187]